MRLLISFLFLASFLYSDSRYLDQNNEGAIVRCIEDTREKVNNLQLSMHSLEKKMNEMKHELSSFIKQIEEERKYDDILMFPRGGYRQE
jgi:uncharacterized protein (UPF0305 family)